MSLLDKYQQLNSNEKRALNVGTVALLLFVLYQFIYQPASNAFYRLQQQARYQIQLQHWLKQVEPLLSQPGSRHQPQAVTPSRLLTLITEQLEKAQLEQFPHQLQQTTQGTFQLSFKAVPYTVFISWLHDFTQHYQIQLEELAVSRTDQIGIVKVKLHFSGQ